MINESIRPFKGRTLEVGDRVRFHRNLHNKSWSIVALTGPFKGLVVAHADEASVWGPRFIVNEAGRQRVLREGKKNVHAFIEGSFSGTIPNRRLLEIRHRVAYNPYVHDSFAVFPRDNGGGQVAEVRDIHRGGFAWGDKEGKAWVIAPRLTPA